MEDTDKILENIAGLMALAARTAPKAKGTDNLIIRIFKKDELPELSRNMQKAGKETARPRTFERDSENVLSASCVLVAATRKSSLGLDCGFCGLSSCGEADEQNITCAYNSGDLGIAAGSAVSRATDLRADNRIMYTIGYTVKKLNLLGEPVAMALGIPLSGTGKNPFFDRK